MRSEVAEKQRVAAAAGATSSAAPSSAAAAHLQQPCFKVAAALPYAIWRRPRCRCSSALPLLPAPPRSDYFSEVQEKLVPTLLAGYRLW